MKTILRLPNNFTRFGPYPIISGHNYKIDTQIEKVLKETHEYGIYLDPLFWGLVWFDDSLGYWVTEVYQDGKYMASYLAETLVELADEIDSDYRNNGQLIF